LCPSCIRERTESILQEKVRLYCESLGFTIRHEHQCTLKCRNPKTKATLPYDNEIVELKLIIEVHGIQHYKITNFHHLAKIKFITTQKALEDIQWKDQYKKDFVLQQGYHYLEIPYWTDDKKETWKQLIDDNKI
jgi:hypothetical protein